MWYASNILYENKRGSEKDYKKKESKEEITKILAKDC